MLSTFSCLRPNVCALFISSSSVCCSNSLRNDPMRNVEEVLQNYEESPDTTYESGDRAAIRNARHTLDHRQLMTSLLRERERGEGMSPISLHYL